MCIKPTSYSIGFRGQTGCEDQDPSVPMVLDGRGNLPRRSNWLALLLGRKSWLGASVSSTQEKTKMLKSAFVRPGLLASLLWALLTVGVEAETTTQTPFDADWLFFKGDLHGGEQPRLDDHAWTRVDLPNDWEIAGPYDENAAATGAGAFLPTGVVWYRKHFVLPDALKEKRVSIEFDGVMERSGVWINGMHLGWRPSGYASFRYDLTPFLKAGDNVISVRADTASQPASRWYAGGGIYRHVRLITSGPIHVETYGSYVTTPKVDTVSASVHIQSSVLNSSATIRTAHLEVAVVGPDGKTLTTVSGPSYVLPMGRATKLSADAALANPHLWNLEDPALHKALIRVVADNGEQLDEDTITFGVRDELFEEGTGFWLNGKNIKIKGAAIHADGGAFGMAVPLSVYERRLRALKMLGVNAIRTAHHPFSPEFLDLCDRLGLLVMDEGFDMWTVAKNDQDYHIFFNDWSSLDAKTMADRDRNHASVFIWSIGNEIHDTPYPLIAKPIVARLRDVFHQEDPSRPVTMALFRPNASHDYYNGLADMLDVVGQNYRENELAKAHADKFDRRILGTENGMTLTSWLAVRDNPAYSGMFLWTGVDYLGETERQGWPVIGNTSGLMDRTGLVKPIGWQRASWWSDVPMVKMARRGVIGTSGGGSIAADTSAGPRFLADWTPTDQTPHLEAVEVYSNAPDVELFLNGVSQGHQPRHADDSERVWNIKYASGELKAVAYNGAKIVATDLLRTAGQPSKIRLTSESDTLAPGFDNIDFVRVEITDENGNVVPSATVPVTVNVTGAGEMAAFDNGSPIDHTAFSSPTRDSFRGHALVMLRATKASGAIVVTATSPGLKSGHATLTAEAQR
jgi:beta-galactosidase